MKTIFPLIILLVSALVVSAQQTICSCTATTTFSNQHRSGAKHESKYNKFAKKKDTVSVKYIYEWEKKYSSLTDSISTGPQKPASKRKKGTPEDSLYILKGYMWFVKQEDNDCDLHVEIGTKDSADTRIAIEVTKENKKLQNKIKKELDKRQLLIMNCGTSDTKKAHFKKGISVLVVGLGFYDVSHKPDTNHGDAHTKKYSWELHPVKDIIFK